MSPAAREEKLLVQEVADQLVVYDQEHHRAHALNRASAWVWRHCDSETSVAELAAGLANALDLPADESVVWMALEQLDRASLLQGPLVRPQGTVSRRQMMRKLALAGGLALLLPVVSSITAPTPLMAATITFSCRASGTKCRGTCPGGKTCGGKTSNCKCR